MKKINFEQLPIATDITHKYCEKMDCREEFANIMYRNGNGVAAYALSLKIYNSSGETEYTDEEINLMQMCANSFCKAFFVDALECVLKINNNVSPQ